MKQLNIRGEPLWVHDNEDLSNHIKRENDFYEAEILDYIKNNFNDHKVIVDIGANIGNHTVYFSRYLRHSYIYAFEPNPSNLDILLKNIEGLPDVLPVPWALSDKTETIHMSQHLTNWGVSKVDPLGPIEAYAVPLDSLWLDNVSLMKIDVESYEPNVLRGAAETIRRCNPIILIEDYYNEYGPLLPNHQAVKGWEINKTYLYVPKGWY